MQKTIFKPQPLAVAVVLALSSQLVQAEIQAQTPANQDTTYLPTSVVTGVAQQSPGVVVTNPKLPRQPVPASDGADYLKTIPGFSAMRSGGVNSDPVFRGMFGSRLKLLTNGGEMLGACPSRMDSPSSYISPETYDQLTVIKGPQSVQWGPGNSAATVLFERGPEQFEDFDTRVDASVLVGSHRRFDRNLDAALGNRLGYVRLTGNKSTAHDYNDGGNRRVPSRWNKWNTDVALGWTPNDDTLLELSGGTGDGESRYAGRGMDGTRFKRESLALRYKQDNLGEVWQAVEAQLYYNYADHIMDNYKLRSAPMMRMATQVDRRTLGGRFKSSWQWDDVSLVAGVDGQTNWHRLRARSGSMPGPLHGNMVKDAEMDQVGVFAELAWDLSDQDRMIGGLRLDRHTAKDKREFLAAPNRRNIPACTLGKMGTNNCVPNSTANKTRKKTLPSGFIRHEHDLASLPATTYLGLGHSQRFPDYWEMFSSSYAVNTAAQTHEPTAFATIDPEKTTQLDFGIQYAQGPYELWASGYVGRIRNYILFEYADAASLARNVNARIMGAELGGSHRFAPGWKAETSLAYAWGKNTSDGRALPQMPPLELRNSLAYEQGDWSTAALWRLVRKQGRVDNDRGNVAGKDFDKSAGFGVFSVNGAYRINNQWKLSSGIDNLFNKKYSEHLNLAGNAGFDLPADSRINEQGRTWWLRVDMNF